ncbi:thioredoxin family protein [Pradoshia sp. D12]|uniref:thioredoxin family protein n=1 Tax=Bacillaceae TaxID=186817 RepID=UPI001126A93F|nr:MULTISPECIES: thioredoxin family protein [Bacillaceae]QFK72715.1 thioredoxin family protein [Pradoshia sp. D12]TPF71709.1 thioredoxin family protein [Bacillus sp. D12]
MNNQTTINKAIYTFTPLCGTCQLAGKMLDIAKEVLPNASLEKVNLNYAKELAEEYQIQSVPCLILIKDNQLIEKIYAFHSVPYLVDQLKRITE